jgi:tetratricopeptide (TPR) repeat protein
MKYSIIASSALVAVVAIGGCAQKTSFDYYLQSQLESQRGNMDAAMAALSVAIEKNPDLGLAYVSRGQLLKAKGDYAEAAQDFEKATKLEPYNFNAHYQLGLMYQYLKRFEDAIAAYQKAVEIRPLDPDANMNLALTYSEIGDPKRGLPYAQKAVDGAPDSATTHANLGTLYGIVDYEDLAIDEFKKSIELNSKQPQVYVNLAAEYIKQLKWEQARQVLEDGKEFGPSPTVSERLALCYYKIGKLDKAAENYEDSLRQNPTYYQAMNGLGAVHMLRSLQSAPADIDQAHEALDLWNKSLKVEPDQPNIRQLIGQYGGTSARANAS